MKFKCYDHRTIEEKTQNICGSSSHSTSLICGQGEAGGGAFQVGDRQMLTLWNRVLILIHSPEVVHSLIQHRCEFIWDFVTANSV